VLPDLPGLKQDLQYIFDGYLRKAIHERMGPFADVPRHIIHEGMEMRVHQADGTADDTGMKMASAQMLIQAQDIPHISVKERIEKLNELADDMAKQIARNLYGSLNESLEKAGQVVDNKGKPFSMESVFAVLEKVDIDFDHCGNPVPGFRFVVGQDLFPRVRELIEQGKNDPSIRKRHDEIMAKKWLEWRDREAARKLVG
jgi:hypothetical protein